MDKKELLIQLRTRKMSALIYDARLAAGRSIQDCAKAMGVSREQYLAFEDSQQSPSLPELEALAYFLNIPLEHFWGSRSLSEAAQEKTSSLVQNFLTERNQEIISRLRQAREEAGLSLQDLADRSGIPVDQLEKYEREEEPVSIPHLELLTDGLHMELAGLFDQSGMVNTWRTQQETLEGFMGLPEELKDFVSRPINRSYLELAHRLSSLSVEKLRLVAEGLLEITY